MLERSSFRRTVVLVIGHGDFSRPRSRQSLLTNARCGGGESFDGCLVFDEAHKAKNFNSVKEENSTKMSQAVIKIQVQWGETSLVQNKNKCSGKCTNIYVILYISFSCVFLRLCPP